MITALAAAMLANPVAAQVRPGPKAGLRDRAVKLRKADALRIEAKRIFTENDEAALEAALPKFEAAKDLYHEIGGQERNEAYCLAAAGYGLSLLGYRHAALVYYGQALELARETKFTLGIADTLSNMGRVYFQLAQNDKALALYNEALALYKQMADRRGQALILTAIGASYSDLGDTAKALENLDRALPLRRSDKKGEAVTLYRIGRVYLDLKQKDEALKYLNQSLALRRQTGDTRGIAQSLIYLSWTYFNFGDKQKSVDLFTEAFDNAREAGDKPGQAKACFGLQTVWVALGKPNLAIYYGKQMVNLYQEIRDGLDDLPDDAGNSYQRSIESAYRKLVDLLISQDRLAEAQAVLDLLKSKEYGGIPRRAGSGDGVTLSPAEALAKARDDAIFKLTAERRTLRQQQKEQGARFPPDKLARLTTVNSEIDAANASFSGALAALREASPGLGASIGEIEKERVLQSVLQDLGRDMNTGVVALYTVIDPSAAVASKPGESVRPRSGWVILVTPAGRKLYPIDMTDLNKNVMLLLTTLKSDRYDPRPPAQRLYNAIFRQTSEKQGMTLEQDLDLMLGAQQNKTIMWMLDGVLRYLPMAALHDGHNYLVEKYRNVVFTGQSIAWLTKPPKTSASMLGLGVSVGNEQLHLSPLDGVQKELSDIIHEDQESTGILPGRRVMNAAFNKNVMFDLADEDNAFQRVHIASHYSFNPADPDASYLLVGEEKDAGKLTFEEMRRKDNLFGSVDLLTLSACDTGVAGNGKESEGFAYLAQSLGAKAVIGSLWKVSDAGTPELMIRFYKQIAADPTMAKGEALRQAQLALLNGTGKPGGGTDAGRAEAMESDKTAPELQLFKKDVNKPYAHPHYWAAFVLFGNWR